MDLKIYWIGMKRQFERFLPIIIGTLLVLIFWNDFIFGNSYLFDMDIHTEFLPLQKFLHYAWSAGGNGWWNPYSGLGIPLLADGHGSFYYIPAIIYRILGASPAGLAPFWCLHLIYCFYFCHKLAKEIGASNQAAYLSAIIFTFSGYLTAIVSTFMYALAISHTPALIYLLIKSTKEKGVKYPFYLAVIFTQQYFIGYVPFTFNTILGLLALYLMIPEKKESFKRILGSAVLAIFLCLPQLLPTLQYLGKTSFSTGNSFEYIVSNSLSPKLLLSYLFPLIWGGNDPNNLGYQDQYTDKMQDYFDFDELHNYIGLFGLLLAFASLYANKNSRYQKSFIVLALASLILGAGVHFPYLYETLMFIPGFSFFKDPAKWSVHLNLSLAMLAALGFDTLFSKEAKRHYIVLTSLGLLLLVLFLVIFMPSDVLLGLNKVNILPVTSFHEYFTPKMFFICSSALALSLLTIAVKFNGMKKIILIFVFLDLFLVESFLIPRTERSFYSDPLAALSKDEYRTVDGIIPREYDSLGLRHLSGDIGAYYQIPTLTVTSPFVTKNWDQVNDWASSKGMIDLQRFSSHASFYELVPFLESLGVNKILEKDGSILPLNNSKTLAYFSSRPETVNIDQGLSRFLDLCSEKQCPEALVEASGSLEGTNENFVPLKLNRVNTEHVEVSVEASHPGVLVYLDQYFPGWSATLNNKEVEIIKVNGMFKGVRIPEKGTYKVEFEFRPLLYVFSKWWFLISWPLIFLLICVTRNFHASCNYGRWTWREN